MHITILEFRDGKEFHPMEAYSVQVLHLNVTTEENNNMPP